MGLKSIKILGISVTTSSREEILEYIQKYLGKPSKKPLVILTPNPEQIVLAKRDSRFTQILNQADVALPDGIGLALAMRLNRIPGIEFMDDLVALAAKRSYPIGLIGGRRGVAVEALECLQKEYPGLTGWAEDPGELPIGDVGDLGNLCEKIGKTKTKLVLVGLGAPKQEYFIEKLTHSPIHPSTHPLILMSVGGSFDFITGRLPRAPWTVRSMGLEWLWRLVREPWRLRRQFALVKFLWLVLGRKIVSKRSESLPSNNHSL